MSVIYIIAIFLFCIALSIVEIPKMLKKKLFREFWTYLVLLLAAMILAVFKAMKIEIPNLADLLAFVFSPVKSVMKGLIK